MSTNRIDKTNEKLPLSRNLIFAIQHVFVMVAGAVAVPMIVGGAAGVAQDTTFLISCALFAAGVATLLQTLGVGSLFGGRIPVIEGTSFASVATMTSFAVQGETGLQVIAGGVIAAGVFCLLFAGVWSRLLRFFPPLVTGTVITVVGISLYPVGINWMTGRPQMLPQYTPELLEVFQVPGALKGYLALAGITFLILILCNKFLKGILGNLSILLSLGAGTLVAILHDVVRADAISAGTMYPLMNVQAVKEASWFGLVTPFKYGPPIFKFGAMISFILVMLVIMTEATGNIIALHNMSGKELKPENLSASLRVSGLSSILSGIFNSYPVTPFGQNVGLVSMTGEFSRFTTATAGGILVALAFMPKFGALFASIPAPVLGGVGFSMFGVVAANGIRTLAEVDFDGNKNGFIVAISLGLAMVPTVAGNFFGHFSDNIQNVFHSGITLGCLSAVILNILFNMILLTPEQKAAKKASKDVK